jgi:hypothetical protein
MQASSYQPFRRSKYHSGRYVEMGLRVDRAEDAERLVRALERETAQQTGVKLEATLFFREPFNVNGRDYFNGWVGIKIELPCPQSLSGLDAEHQHAWHMRMRETFQRSFGEFSVTGLTYASIDFSEPDAEKLYALTPEKEKAIRDGFENVRKALMLYRRACEAYDALEPAFWNGVEQSLGPIKR